MMVSQQKPGRRLRTSSIQEAEGSPGGLGTGERVNEQLMPTL